MGKSQELPDITAMLEEPYLFVGIYAGDDPHTDEPHISWVKAHEQMETGDRLFIVKKAKPAPDLLEHCQNCSEEVAKWPEWKRRGADVTKFQGENNV